MCQIHTVSIDLQVKKFIDVLVFAYEGIHTIHNMYVIKDCGPKKETNFRNGQKYGLM